MRNFLSKHKWPLVIVAALAVLGLAFWYGGSAPGLQGWTAAAPTVGISEAAAPSPDSGAEIPVLSAFSPPSSPVIRPSAAPSVSAQATPSAAPSPSQTPPKVSTTPAPGSDSDRPMTPEEKLATAAAIAGQKSSDGVVQGDTDYSESQGMQLDASTGKDKYNTDPVPAGKPVPVEPEDAVISDAAHTCTLSISCATINDNLSWLDPEKKELVPADGWILQSTTVTFYEGESVFNVLLRTCKLLGIHMEYANTPMYNSAYIEGINNLYEFDCGELSGWMYKVNDWFPNYGCSRYQLQDGDVIEWVYTCSLGIDVGGYYSVGS